ncbi:hypothetical protein [Sphingomonas sp.]|uniref:hypothetical protein n=1 Tax=Sphingomonas sp. TaxID=28214 RepID=UPI0028AF1E8B|nr:hypothetical protein [Sphingomonas sp.]
MSDLALADRTLLLAALHALTNDGKEALNELIKVGALIDAAEKMAQEHKDLVVPHAD